LRIESALRDKFGLQVSVESVKHWCLLVCFSIETK
jgi:hypothetical protein